MDKNAFFKFTYGLYIVSSMDGERYNGHISNTVFQVTADPPRFVVASHKDNLTTDFIRKSGVFSVSILPEDISMDFLGPWGFKTGKDIDKFESCNYQTGVTGCPILLDHTIAWVECQVIDSLDTGTHILFLGNVVGAEILEKSSRPLTYDYYRNVIKGLSPENSPTYVAKVDSNAGMAETEKDELQIDDKDMSKYKCTICGYVYDPAEGDPTKNFPPGTPFGELPHDWICPICGVGKNEFVKVKK